MYGRPRFHHAANQLILLGFALALSLASPAARADRIQLRDGSHLKGALLDDLETSATIRVLIENSARPLVFHRDQIVRVIPEPDVFDDYFAIRDSFPNTADGQFKLGQWCEQHSLSGLAPTHYTAAVQLDKNHAEANKKLGHVLHEGAWITHDELKRAQGLVLRDGQWISADELERRNFLRSESAAHDKWTRQLDLLRRHLKAGPAEERQIAENQLFAIDDPAAVPALLEVFGREELPLRALLVRRLAAAPWPEARLALARLALVETDATLWNQILLDLEARPDTEIAKIFIAALDTRNLSQAARAARALARLKTRSAVPALIQALVKVEVRMVPVPVTGRAVGPGAPSPTPNYTGLIGQAYVANVEPVVGEGVIAYRPIVSNIGSGVTTGGTSYPNNQPATPTFSLPSPARFYYPNKEVLTALEEITGRNFGYDKTAWNRWLETSFRVEQQPARRVLEP